MKAHHRGWFTPFPPFFQYFGLSSKFKHLLLLLAKYSSIYSCTNLRLLLAKYSSIYSCTNLRYTGGELITKRFPLLCKEGLREVIV